MPERQLPRIARTSRAGGVTWLDLETSSSRGSPEAGRSAPRAEVASAPFPASKPVGGAREVAIAPHAPGPSDPRGAEQPAAPREAGAAASPGATAPDEPGPEEYGPTESAPKVIAGLGGAPIWAMPGVLGPAPGPAPAPTVAPAARPVDKAIAGKVLRSALLARDKEIGLDLPAAGTVATTVADVVRGSDAPLRARATFEIQLGGDGQVLGVRLAHASAGKADVWARVVKNVATALASRPLALGSRAPKGATVHVNVVSKVVYPAGEATVELDPSCADEAAVADAQASEEDRTGERRPLPDLTSKGRRFCVPNPALRARFDLSNIGSHTQRLVTSSFEVVLPDTVKLPAEVRAVDTSALWPKELPAQIRGPR